MPDRFFDICLYSNFYTWCVPPTRDESVVEPPSPYLMDSESLMEEKAAESSRLLHPMNLHDQ